MPNLNPNSTSYVHTHEPNTNDLIQAMDYNPAGQPVLRIDDTSLQHTSKDRAKVSNYEVNFFNTFQYDAEPDIWDEVTTTGGSAVHNSVRRELDLTVDGTQAGAKVVRQTRNVMRYIPGRTSEVTFSFVMGAGVAGIRKRIGIFDDRNGLFFEQIGDELAFVVRSDTTGSVVDTRILQSDWNQDKLDGSDPKGTTLDITKRQMVVFEYEWYGAGIAELKFVIDDHPISCHKKYHANRVVNSYMATPFLPLRAEVENVSATSGTATLTQNSTSYIQEGTAGKQGIAVNYNSPITGTRMSTANSWFPVLSLRLKPDKLEGIATPTAFQVATIDNTNIFFRMVRNATIGTGGGPWTNVPDSNATFTQYQIYTNPSAIIEANQGSIIESGFVISGNSMAKTFEQDVLLQLGRRTTTTIGDTSDVFTILCASPNTGKDALASLTWTEQR